MNTPVFPAGEIMTLLFVCSLIPQVVFLLARLGLISSLVDASETTTLALVELASVALPLYGACFVLLCVRCSSHLRAKAQKVLPGPIGQRLFADAPPVAKADVQGEGRRHFANLAKAWN